MLKTEHNFLWNKKKQSLVVAVYPSVEWNQLFKNKNRINDKCNAKKNRN